MAPLRAHASARLAIVALTTMRRAYSVVWLPCSDRLEKKRRIAGLIVRAVPGSRDCRATDSRGRLSAMAVVTSSPCGPKHGRHGASTRSAPAIVGTTTRSTKAGRKQNTKGKASRTAARPASASARSRALLRSASARAASASAGGAPHRSAASSAAAAALSSSRLVRSPTARSAAAGVRPMSSSAAARASSPRRAAGLRCATRMSDRYGLRPASRQAPSRSMTAGAAAARSARSFDAARLAADRLTSRTPPLAASATRPGPRPTSRATPTVATAPVTPIAMTRPRRPTDPDLAATSGRAGS